MFLEFFNVLRLHGLKISLDEWLVLIDALNRGMAENSLMEFYYLCRNVLIKSETEYDKFDQAFAEYFKGIESVDEIPQELRDWLSHDELERMLEDMPDWAKEYDLDTLRKMFRERLSEQTEKHDGGNYWVGTGGTSPFGHGGYNPAGIRVGGEGRHQSAIQIAGERNFRDFRQDNELDTRQFQMAFRKLRQFSSRVDAAKTELDIDATIDATCDNAGLLKLVYEKPRKNTVKLLLLMDSDGSMRSYSRLCSQLFQAVNQSTHLKDLKIYYFHNCIYDYLYTDPYIIDGRWIETDWVFRNLGSDYKVIIVGDAAMSSYELTARGGNINWYAWNNEPGLDWLKKFNRFYHKVIWLNPIKESRWTHAWGARTIQMVREIFPMFELTLNGLDKGIHKLLTN
ncbi:MAG: VWA domain-containing protein [Clostridiales bacterium]|nr:VWA domain-containing protein [Clostridiales bacterium]